jgi:uncharacterized protein
VIKSLFSSTFQAAEADALAERLNPTPGTTRRTWVVMVWTAAALTLINYAGNATGFATFLGQCGLGSLKRQFTEWALYHDAAQLHQLIWWALVSITNYMLVPLLLIRFVLCEPIGDYGLQTKAALRGWPLYAVMLMVMLPLVAYFSGTTAFQQKYPFYQPDPDEPIWPRFWIWEAFYFGQFVALEFFFRGFMTLGLRKQFGYFSVLVMMVPYCMIHFRKPMPETFGAIAAGIVLGTLSLKSRSIWLGVLIHYSVAISMDMFALWRRP